MPDIAFAADETDLDFDLLPPDVALAGLPASLIVSGLESQLSRAASGYTPSDYLAPILDAVALLRRRHAGNSAVLSELSSHVSKILARVVDAVGHDWGVELSTLGLTPGTTSYEDDVLELYRFFVADRLEHARELTFQTILTDRRRLADRFRRAVEKRNQTVSEARRVFASFDDVVIWVSLPEILTTLREEPESWSFDLAEALARLGGEPGVAGAGFLAMAADTWLDRGFAARFVTPALSQAEELNTVLELRERWLATAQKKTEGTDE